MQPLQPFIVYPNINPIAELCTYLRSKMVNRWATINLQSSALEIIAK
jgi:hypothetical protein